MRDQELEKLIDFDRNIIIDYFNSEILGDLTVEEKDRFFQELNWLSRNKVKEN